tara:strand:+ start:757 stop:1005 length:249 start_codon:yes stop_codon:yes gene_type:complete
MIQEINGYKYTIGQEAINARKQCADYYGLPKTPEDVTKYWVNYVEASLDTPVFWYIVFDDSIEVILGEPTLFEVTVEELIIE